MNKTSEIKEYVIDCKKLLDRENAHDYFKSLFGFPEYYGGNLDALYDCLTELGPCTIALINPWGLADLGRYAGQIIEVFADAAHKNRNITLK